MKYIIICVAAMLVCFGVAYGIMRLIRKKAGKPKKGLMTLLPTVGAGLVLMAGGTFAYLGIYSHAGEVAEAAMRGDETVAVSEVDGGYFFDGPGESKALVFYPGAKVESAAYAPLMLRISKQGIDCFLAEMPFNFAILGSNTADAFTSAYAYDSWIMAGHSMGGFIAANYAIAHADTISGIALLASYATSPVDERLSLCSIYGSLDGCLDWAEYEAKQTNWPTRFEEVVIEGGNHAQYGDYGQQSGDNEATMSAEEQQEATAQAIADFF